MMGVATGILFFMANQTFGSLSLVYRIPAIWGAIMPSLLFTSVALYFFNKKV